MLALIGAVAVYLFFVQTPSKGELDTALKGVTLVEPSKPVKPSTPAQKPKPKPHPHVVTTDAPCWPIFGGGPKRNLARVHLDLGRPGKAVWARALHSYIEFPPSYCQGKLYVNTFRGRTFAIDARTGHVLWMVQGPGSEPSTPAIAGDRLIVTSKVGTVTALNRANGKILWRLHLDANVESSPVVIGRLVYFGASDGRVFAAYVGTGRIRWAYNTGGIVNSSPTILGNRVFVTTYAGSIFALNRFNGQRIWVTFIKRDYVLYDSFYASLSTDGQRLFTISRSGQVVALRASDGSVLWTHNLDTTGYSTPAVANGRIYVGDFNGYLHSYDAVTGNQVWQTYVGGRILGPGLVVGPLVFFSTLEQKTYGLLRSNGRVVWHVGMGKYAPGIATDRHYFFSLNGILVSFRGQQPKKRVVVVEGVHHTRVKHTSTTK